MALLTAAVSIVVPSPTAPNLRTGKTLPIPWTPTTVVESAACNGFALIREAAIPPPASFSKSLLGVCMTLLKEMGEVLLDFPARPQPVQFDCASDGILSGELQVIGENPQPESVRLLRPIFLRRGIFQSFCRRGIGLRGRKNRLYQDLRLLLLHRLHVAGKRSRVGNNANMGASQRLCQSPCRDRMCKLYRNRQRVSVKNRDLDH